MNDLIQINNKIIDKKSNPKINDKYFTILNFDEYNKLKEFNYRVTQLKKLCKHYKLKTTGKKDILLNNLYKFLYGSFFSVKIQKLTRGYLLRKWLYLHGPAVINRKICTNESDFFTMENISSIPLNQFFSFKDEDNFIYGFNILSLNTLIKKSNDSSKNPYNRKNITLNIRNKLNKLIMLTKKMKIKIDVNIKNETENLSRKQILEMRIISLFQRIDELGNYTNHNWFTNLSRQNYVVFIRELYDIWIYRAQLSNNVKQLICPPVGNPFVNVNINILNTYSLEQIRNVSLLIMEQIVNINSTVEYRSLGAYFLLTALTIVSEDARNSLPWLYTIVA